jgi:hypothetical protein
MPTRPRSADVKEERVPDRTPSSRASSGAGYWPIIAVIAIIVATAGWTTVAVMAMNGGTGGTGDTAEASPAFSEEPVASDDLGTDPSDEPIPDSHEVPELEALLPAQVAGTDLAFQSWTGETLLSDGGAWSESITAYLTTAGKTPADLTAAQAVDPTDTIDQSVGVFHLDGVPVSDLRDALVAAFKADYPELAVSTVKLDGIEVTKGDFGADAINSYWYEKDGNLYDVESADEAIATTILQGIRDGTLNAPASGAPASTAPSPS